MCALHSLFLAMFSWFYNFDLLFKFQRVFLEGNPYLLGITMVVSLLHSVFDFLAFKNGILSSIALFPTNSVGIDIRGVSLLGQDDG